MSFLEQFLKESSVGRSNSHAAPPPPASTRPERVSADSTNNLNAAARRGMSIESDDGDVEDNRVPSLGSSRSNMSDFSPVSLDLNLSCHPFPQ